MYEKFFGLSGKPFQLMPDTRFFYRSAGHQRALAYMRYGLQQGQGFIVITGDIGTGKSLLLNALVSEMNPEELLPVRITCSHLDHEQVLKVIAGALLLAYEGRDKAALLSDIEAACQQASNAGKRVIVLVDEAQNLPFDGLEELRMLSNVEYRGQPIMQCFLLGQREFRNTLRAPGLEQLRQRVIAAYHLRSLSEGEVRKYIQHRLKTAGWRDDPRIEEPVYAMITAATLGIPRRINLLMDRLLLNCFLDELHYIDEDRTSEVIREIELEVGSGHLADEDDADPIAAVSGGGLRPSGEATSALPASHTQTALTSSKDQKIDDLQARVSALAEQNERLTRDLMSRAGSSVHEDGLSEKAARAAGNVSVSHPGEDAASAWAPAFQGDITRDDMTHARRNARRWQVALFLAAVVVLAGAGAAAWVLQSRL